MNEFIQLTDSQTEEPVFIAPNEIKSIHQLVADDNYGRRTVIVTTQINLSVKEEATKIALTFGRRFIQLTDYQTEEPVFIMPSEIKYMHQLPVEPNYGRRTVIDGFVVKEEATDIALAIGRGFIDKEETQQYSKTHKRLSERLQDPEVLTNPKKFLGRNYEQVLEFWLGLDGLSEDQWMTIDGLYWNFYRNQRSEWNEAADEAYKASNETIGSEFAYHAAFAVVGVYGGAAYCATLEIIGGVADKVFLPMFNDL